MTESLWMRSVMEDDSQPNLLDLDRLAEARQVKLWLQYDGYPVFEMSGVYSTIEVEAVTANWIDGIKRKIGAEFEPRKVRVHRSEPNAR